jgi:hypothetical protein
MDSRYAIRKKILMCVQITIRSADVDPVSAGRYVCKEGFLAVQKIGNSPYSKSSFRRRNEIEHARSRM